MSLNRRSFLNQSAAALAGTALSYSRIQGANERISLGHIGIGSRGSELAWIASRLKDGKNCEMTAVCDLWKINRERAVEKATAVYGRAPRSFQHMEDLLALKSQLIATHTKRQVRDGAIGGPAVRLGLLALTEQGMPDPRYVEVIL